MPAAQLIWLRRKVRQVCEGGLFRRGMYLATVDWATAMPSLSNSPWIRGAPQPGFSVAMRRMSVRRSALIEGRPVGRDRQRQKRRKPRRCQRMTVAGRTMASVSRQPGQDRELLAQGEVLQNEVGAGTEQGADSGREGAQQGEHTSLGRRTDRWQQVAPPSGETARRCASAPDASRAGVRGRTFQ